MAKARELNEQSNDQLSDTLRDAYQQLFKLRFQQATEKLDKPQKIRNIRRDIARIKTLQRMRELQTAEKS